MGLAHCRGIEGGQHVAPEAMLASRVCSDPEQPRLQLVDTETPRRPLFVNRAGSLHNLAQVADQLVLKVAHVRQRDATDFRERAGQVLGKFPPRTSSLMQIKYEVG